MTQQRKSIFITGAASGIGRAAGVLFAQHGWLIGAADVNAPGLAALQEELGADNCATRLLDVTDRADFQAALAEFTTRTGGTLDVMFNNAGIGRGGPFADMAWADIIALVNVNFIGVLTGIHAAIPYLRATPGSLCFTTSSSSATYGMPNLAVYSATKHAVKGLTEALAVELRALGIRAADTLPGLIDTGILPPGTAENAPRSGMFRITPPGAVAQAVWDAYYGDKLHYYVPDDIAALDRRATLDPEGIRDSMLAGTFFAGLQEES